MTSRKPNILYVFSDQQRASAIGCAYGDEDLVTPNFDALASGGVRLEAAVSNSPVCTPYRAMLMTGLYGHHTGVTTNNCYPDLSRHPHIGRTLSDAYSAEIASRREALFPLSSRFGRGLQLVRQCPALAIRHGGTVAAPAGQSRIPNMSDNSHPVPQSASPPLRDRALRKRHPYIMRP